MQSLGSGYFRQPEPVETGWSFALLQPLLDVSWWQSAQMPEEFVRMLHSASSPTGQWP